jgi:hypothetical protein
MSNGTSKGDQSSLTSYDTFSPSTPQPMYNWSAHRNARSVDEREPLE